LVAPSDGDLVLAVAGPVADEIRIFRSDGWEEIVIPADLSSAEIAHRQGVSVHQTRKLGAWRKTVDAVVVRHSEVPACAPADTRPVLVRCPKDVAGFVSEHAIDVVRPPAIVRVVHHHLLDDSVCEVVKSVLGEEGHVGPVGVPAGT